MVFVLTGEGELFLDKGTWTTHAVLGVWQGEGAARAAREHVRELLGEEEPPLFWSLLPNGNGWLTTTEDGLLRFLVEEHEVVVRR